MTQRPHTGKIVEIDVDIIDASPYQARRVFDENELKRLSLSISENGILQPLCVKKTQGGRYVLVAGERRLRAAKLAGWRSVPCTVTRLSDEECALLGVMENIQRKDLNYFEYARALKELLQRGDVTQEQLAKSLGVSQPSIANKLRLLNIDAWQQSYIIEMGLSERHARALLSVEDRAARKKIIERVAKKNLTVAETERYIAETQRANKSEKPKRRAVVRDVRIFINTLNKAVEIMRRSGVRAEVAEKETDGMLEYTVKIQNTRPNNAVCEQLELAVNR